MDEFPLPSETKQQLIDEKYLFLDKINYLITGDEELIHRIEVKNLKLEEKKQPINRKHQTAEKQASMLHAEFGTDINLRVISIARFYHLIELLKSRQSNG